MFRWKFSQKKLGHLTPTTPPVGVPHPSPLQPIEVTSVINLTQGGGAGSLFIKSTLPPIDTLVTGMAGAAR